MRMTLLMGLSALFGVRAFAQEETPLTEVGLQYQMLRVNSSRNVPAFTANGGTASFQMNFMDHLAGVAELGAEHNGNIHSVHLDNTWTTFLFGPRVSITKRSSRIVPARLTAVQLAFAPAVGGTLDIRLNHRFSIRPIQLDYLLTRLGSKTSLNGFETFNQDNSLWRRCRHQPWEHSVA